MRARAADAAGAAGTAAGVRWSRRCTAAGIAAGELRAAPSPGGRCSTCQRRRRRGSDDALRWMALQPREPDALAQRPRSRPCRRMPRAPYGPDRDARAGGRGTAASRGSARAAAAAACARGDRARRRGAGHAGPDRLPHPPGVRRRPRREFEPRLQGASYEEIARAGGGIVSTVRPRARPATSPARRSRGRRRAAAGRGRDDHRDQVRLRPVRATEARCAARRRLGWSDVTVRTTFLGAHALPPEFAGRADDYIAAVSADGCRAACAGPGRRRRRVLRAASASSPAQTRRVFEARARWACR